MDAGRSPDARRLHHRCASVHSRNSSGKSRKRSSTAICPRQKFVVSIVGVLCITSYSSATRSASRSASILRKPWDCTRNCAGSTSANKLGHLRESVGWLGLLSLRGRLGILLLLGEFDIGDK